MYYIYLFKFPLSGSLVLKTNRVPHLRKLSKIIKSDNPLTKSDVIDFCKLKRKESLFLPSFKSKLDEVGGV